MPESWLSVPNAVCIIADAFAMSIGAAGAALCEACAHQQIRWHQLGFHSPPNPEAWRIGHIDNKGDLVSGIFRYEAPFLRISGGDLAYWLRQHPCFGSPAKEDRDAAQPGEVGATGADASPGQRVASEAAVRELAQVLGENLTEAKLTEEVNRDYPGTPRQRIRDVLKELEKAGCYTPRRGPRSRRR